MSTAGQLIDDMSRPWPTAANGAPWALVTDGVMGGVSTARLQREFVSGRSALQLQGEISLQNDGGFVQAALDLAPDGAAVDASGWAGLEVDLFGNDERYNLHLRTADVRRPWQSWRHSFVAASAWRSIRLEFAAFEAHRIDVSLDLTRLRRIGIVAIGREFRADIAIGGIRFYA